MAKKGWKLSRSKKETVKSLSTQPVNSAGPWTTPFINFGDVLPCVYTAVCLCVNHFLVHWRRIYIFILCQCSWLGVMSSSINARQSAQGITHYATQPRWSCPCLLTADGAWLNNRTLDVIGWSLARWSTQSQAANSLQCDKCKHMSADRCGVRWSVFGVSLWMNFDPSSSLWFRNITQVISIPSVALWSDCSFDLGLDLDTNDGCQWFADND